MNKKGDWALGDEVEMARVLLSHAVGAIAYLATTPPADLNANDIRPGSLPVIGRMVLTPAVSHLTIPRVRKVRFLGHDNQGSHQGHPVPNPMILAAKAAVVWSTRSGMRLAAGEEPQHGDWTEFDDLDAEEYIQVHARSLRPQSWEHLAHGLGQPNGFHGIVEEVG
jgi:hypothetical protein